MMRQGRRVLYKKQNNTVLPTLALRYRCRINGHKMERIINVLLFFTGLVMSMAMPYYPDGAEDDAIRFRGPTNSASDYYDEIDTRGDWDDPEPVNHTEENPSFHHGHGLQHGNKYDHKVTPSEDKGHAFKQDKSEQAVGQTNDHKHGKLGHHQSNLEDKTPNLHPGVHGQIKDKTHGYQQDKYNGDFHGSYGDHHEDSYDDFYKHSHE